MKGITCVTLCVYTACLMLATSRALDGSGLDASAEQYLSRRNAEVARDANKMSLASWAYDCNLTETNKQAMMALQNENAAKSKSEWEQWKLLKWDEKWNQTTNPNLQRQLKQFSVQGMSALPSDKFSNLSEITADMVATYSTAHVDMCVELQNESVCDLNLEPELTQLLDQVRDYNVLTEAWVRWRDASGKRVRNNFLEYVQLSNEAARLNGFSDMSEMWLDPYESPSFQSDIEKIWQEVKPLYEQLHAYVRRKLREEYGANHVNLTGPIPASILGNMWAQSWGGIYDLVQPFPNKPTLDVTAAMKSQGYTAKKMFELADKFYTELNLIPMPASFWEKSVLTKPPGVDMVCHASAWDFYDGQDFRIKMCTDITMDDLFTIHHEMGHIEYYLHYKDQPYVFRSGANPGFHEAVGDSLALSVRTPKHLHKIGLLEQIVDDKESDINFLMKVALDKVTFLPFGYLIDKYRWRVFSGNITAQDLNCEWWNMRYELQGLKPPVQRSEEDFDPGAKYHVVADVPYIRYFVSFIVQFQFHKAMCLKAGQYDPNDPNLPLHKCDIDKSTAAGEALGAMLRLGSSKPWPDALESLTGSRTLDASVLREYFAPLERWLKADNERHGEYVGWIRDGEYCQGPPQLRQNYNKVLHESRNNQITITVNEIE